MKKYPRLLTVILVLVLLGALPLLASCKKKDEQPARQAKIKTPNIIKEGTLKVGINLGFAPYATEQGGTYTGYDVEVAKYLAEKLGLKPEFVAIDPDQIAEALGEGTVDVVLSAPMDTSDVAVLGPYSQGGIAYYSNSAAQDNSSDISVSYPVGAQKNSQGYWKLMSKVGEQNVKVYKTDSALIADITSGKIKYGVLDSVVGSYAQAGGSKIKLVDYVDGKSALGVALSPEKQELANLLEPIMNSSTTTSLFESLNRKWFTGVQEKSAQ